MNVGKEILFLFLGWLLGMLSPLIVSWVQRRGEAVRAKLMLATELKATRLRSVSAVYIITMRFGVLDRALLEWVYSGMDAYDGPLADANARMAVEELMKRSDAELAAMAERSQASGHRALALKTFQTPFLDSQIGQLAMYNGTAQSILTELKAQLAFLNEQVAESRFFYRITFDGGLSAENAGIVKGNLRDTYAQVAKRAQHVTELIDKYFAAQS